MCHLPESLLLFYYLLSEFCYFTVIVTNFSWEFVQYVLFALIYQLVYAQFPASLHVESQRKAVKWSVPSGQMGAAISQEWRLAPVALTSATLQTLPHL